MLCDFMGEVLYSLIWILQFKSLLLPRVQWGEKRLSMYKGNAKSTALVSLKIITPSAYQSWERGGIIYRDINSLRQSIEFYNLSVIGCIVPSAKSTEFHVIKIKKRVQEYAFNYHFRGNNFCLLAFILAIKREASCKLCHNNNNKNNNKCYLSLLSIWLNVHVFLSKSNILVTKISQLFSW